MGSHLGGMGGGKDSIRGKQGHAREEEDRE